MQHVTRSVDQLNLTVAYLLLDYISISGPSPCENNAGCSQLCVVNPTGSRCMCKAGQVLAEDGISCKCICTFCTISFTSMIKIMFEIITITIIIIILFIIIIIIINIRFMVRVYNSLM